MRRTMLIIVGAMGALVVHACTLDFGRYRDPNGAANGGAGGSNADGGGGSGAGGSSADGGGGTNAGGSNAGGGGGGGVPTGGAGGTPGLGADCVDDDDCTVGECCTDEACLGNCMMPCNGATTCPEAGMECTHSYCLYPCTVDGDCDMQDYVCHHGCRFCEKKETENCTPP